MRHGGVRVLRGDVGIRQQTLHDEARQVERVDAGVETDHLAVDDLQAETQPQRVVAEQHVEKLVLEA